MVHYRIQQALSKSLGGCPGCSILQQNGGLQKATREGEALVNLCGGEEEEYMEAAGGGGVEEWRSIAVLLEPHQGYHNHTHARTFKQSFDLSMSRSLSPSPSHQETPPNHNDIPPPQRERGQRLTDCLRRLRARSSPSGVGDPWGILRLSISRISMKRL